MSQDTQLTWVAGYEKPADWGDSTMLDGLFMMEYAKFQMDKQDLMSKGKLRGQIRTVDIIGDVCAVIMDRHRGLVKELGFNVFLRRTAISPIFNLMEEEKEREDEEEEEEEEFEEV
ncbi:MAG TPA: hypothetical protein VK446_14520 [Methylocystis sp.]|nr:hypothetical protein [Methylocystis sp.]